MGTVPQSQYKGSGIVSYILPGRRKNWGTGGGVRAPTVLSRHRDTYATVYVMTQYTSVRRGQCRTAILYFCIYMCNIIII